MSASGETMSPDRGWKRAERMIAKDCGGQRIPVTGERHGADVSHSLFSFQLKVRRALPVWLFLWLDGICRTARGQSKVGILVLNKPRRPRREALVILRWADFCDLHGTPALPEADDAVDPHVADPLETSTRVKEK